MSAKLDPTTQVVKCGAVLALSKEIEEHGIVLVHPEMPLIKILVRRDKGRLDYAFAAVEKISPEITDFAVEVIAPEEPKVIVNSPKLIIPE